MKQNQINEVLAKIYPLSTQKDRDRFAIPLWKAMLWYDINTPNRQRAFLAQGGHECMQLLQTVESFNYSAERLAKVFPKYFPTIELSNQYARQPEKIANRVYANRMGNGSEVTGDGWKFRGRGFIHITGYINYSLINDMPGIENIDFVKNPQRLEEPKYAADSAAYWWQKNGLNQLSDKLDAENEEDIFKQITKKVNGGYNGLEDRISIYNRTKKAIV